MLAIALLCFVVAPFRSYTGMVMHVSLEELNAPVGFKAFCVFAGALLAEWLLIALV